MHILITGATGFIGKNLTKKLLSLGHEITVVSRNKEKGDRLFGMGVQTIQRNDISRSSIESVACIIHLAGASISTFPWNTANKKKIYTSRIQTTKLLVDNLPARCHTFLCGSAIGYYPSSFEKIYDSSFINKQPTSFMETLCAHWEQEAQKAQSDKIRVVTLRSGLVIGPDKLGKLLRTTTRRMGGMIMGSGQQRMPLIPIDEWVERCIHIIENRSINGPVNMVTRNIRHEEYIRNLAKELHRPVRLRIPSWAIKMVLGEASSLLLGSWHVKPTKC